MLTAKERTSIRRMSALFGVIGGGLLTAFARYTTGGPVKTDHLLIFINISSWPSYTKSWLPLDIAESCIAFGVVMYAFMHGPPSVTEPRYYLRIGRGIVVVVGCAGLLLMDMFGGWLAGLEGFVLFPLVFLAVAAFLAACAGVVAGAGWCGYKACQHIGRTPLGRPFVRFGHYLNADGIPDKPVLTIVPDPESR